MKEFIDEFATIPNIIFLVLIIIMVLWFFFRKRKKSTRRIFLIVFIMFILFLYWLFFSPSKKEPEQNGYKNQTQYGYISLTTPCEYEMNSGFTLESDDSIAQKFPGIKEIIIYPGRGELWVPHGRLKGLIKFFDPSNPKEGHKNFKIYPQ